MRCFGLLLVFLVGSCGESLTDDDLKRCARNMLLDNNDQYITSVVKELNIMSEPFLSRTETILPPGFSNVVSWRGERHIVTVFVADRSCKTKIAIEPTIESWPAPSESPREKSG